MIIHIDKTDMVFGGHFFCFYLSYVKHLLKTRTYEILNILTYVTVEIYCGINDKGVAFFRETYLKITNTFAKI